MYVLFRCNINAGVHSRAGGADVSLRDVTIETRDRKRGKGVLMTSRTGSARRILGDLKKSVRELSPGSEEDD